MTIKEKPVEEITEPSKPAKELTVLGIALADIVGDDKVDDVLAVVNGYLLRIGAGLTLR